jgi:DNA replication licensing factor MCM6
MGSLNRGVQGLKQLGVRELTYKLVFLASSVNPSESKHRASNIVDETEEDVARYAKSPDFFLIKKFILFYFFENEYILELILSHFTNEERQQIFHMKYDRDLYNNIVRSVAPAVWGHDDVKRGILLMLFGGVHKVCVLRFAFCDLSRFALCCCWCCCCCCCCCCVVICIL